MRDATQEKEMTGGRFSVREAGGEAVNQMQSLIITEEPTSNLGGWGGGGRGGQRGYHATVGDCTS